MTNPTILNSLFPTRTIFSYTDNDVQTIIAGVQTLSVSLRAIADQGEGVVFEVLVDLGKRPICALVDCLFRPGKIECLDTSNLLENGNFLIPPSLLINLNSRWL
jgi:hypothetical protein